jgi:uncharacterized protein (DUF2141 family)
MMLLRLVAVVDLDTDVMSAAEIQRKLTLSLDNIRNQNGVENVVVDTVQRRDNLCTDINNIVFRTASYEPVTGKRMQGKKK